MATRCYPAPRSTSTSSSKVGSLLTTSSYHEISLSPSGSSIRLLTSMAVQDIC